LSFSSDNISLDIWKEITPFLDDKRLTRTVRRFYEIEYDISLGCENSDIQAFVPIDSEKSLNLVKRKCLTITPPGYIYASVSLPIKNGEDSSSNDIALISPYAVNMSARFYTLGRRSFTLAAAKFYSGGGAI
jgi:hypothetical protein